MMIESSKDSELQRQGILQNTGLKRQDALKKEKKNQGDLRYHYNVINTKIQRVQYKMIYLGKPSVKYKGNVEEHSRT